MADARRSQVLKGGLHTEQQQMPTADLLSLLDKVLYTLIPEDAQEMEPGPFTQSGTDESDEESSASEVENHPHLRPPRRATLIDALLRVLDLRTRLLMQILPTIEQVVASSERGNRPPKKAKEEAFQMSSAADLWYRQILDKFGDIDDALAQRLGEANRQRFDDLRRVRARATSTTINVQDIEQAKSYFHPLASIRDSGLGTSIVTPTEAPMSVASHSSFASSIIDGTSRRVPKTPAAVSLGEPLTCEICCQVLLSIRTRTQWK